MLRKTDLIINEQIRIPMQELQFRFLPSGGPGGQHVNRSATQVVLEFDLAESPSLSDAQKDLIRTKWKSYVDGKGIVHLSSQTFRSQIRNKQDVIFRFEGMLRNTLRRVKARRPTAPSRSAREKRLTEKHRQASLKKNRKTDSSDSF